MKRGDFIPVVLVLFILTGDNTNRVAASRRYFRNIKLINENEDNRDLVGEIQPRIVGGAPADGSNYPFYAIPINSNGLCGATLVHEDILVTAAHCAGVFENEVALGASTITGDDALEVIQVSGEYANPDFSYYTLRNDVMLVKLESSSSATPVPINNSSAVPADGATVTVIGFGATYENGRPSRELLEVQVEVVDYDTCYDKYWQPFWGSNIVDEKMICAGTPADSSEDADSCQGDSGGPMLTSTGAIAGIVSFGSGCGRSGIPGVYTRVSGVIDFIRNGICELSSSPPDYCGSTGGTDTGGTGTGTDDGTDTGDAGGNTGTGNGTDTGSDGGDDGGDSGSSDLSECTLGCTFAWIFSGLVLHTETGSSCEEICALAFIETFLSEGYKCGLCPN